MPSLKIYGQAKLATCSNGCRQCGRYSKARKRNRRTRTNTEDASANAFLGYQAQLNQVLPEAVNQQAVDLDMIQTEATARAKLNGKEDIEVKVAAVVTQVLPNGNLVIRQARNPG